jgi:CheY-like chemotaxis protein
MKKNRRIFFADDDNDDLTWLKEVSDELGHTATFFYCGSTMLEALSQSKEKPEIIFLDIRMPALDGFEVLAKLRAMDEEVKNIPVIIHSGKFDDKTIQKCYDLGASYYIPKANNYDSLKLSIEYAINAF